MASFVRPEKLPRQQPRLSKWEKEDLRDQRRTRLSKFELLREDISDRLRCPLCFCLPCVLIVFILLILIGIYVIQPYIQGRGLVSTQCRVNRTEMSERGSCSYRTDKFYPCLKIFVHYSAEQESDLEAVLMENEQALAHCEKCSYTFGNSDLFASRYTRCSWNSDLSAKDCAQSYLAIYGRPNKTFSCYFDPDNKENVARIIKVSGGEAAALIVIPVLFLFLWLSAFLFLLYDRYLQRKIQKEVIQKKEDKNVSTANGGSLSPGNLNGGFEIETTTTTSADSTTVTTVSTPGTRGRRKKKMPCSRPHYQFNYLDEGILLEDKPLSSTTRDMYDYSFVTVDTSPVCTCHHNGYLQAGFDLLPSSRDYLAPTSSTPTGRLPYRTQKGRMFLPESFV